MFNVVIPKSFLALSLIVAPWASSLDVQPLLDAGDFAGAKVQLKAVLAESPDDADARLALGVTTFLGGVEEFVQTMYAHGLRDDVGGEFGMIFGPSAMLPVRFNPEPLKTSVDDVMTMLERMEEAMAEVDAILEPIGDAEAHFDLRVGTVKMDLNGDGKLADDEGLWRLYEAVINPRNGWGGDEENESEMPEEAQTFVLGLDTADAYWLRGYCNVFGAVGDVLLAHDHKELFERVGHLLFDHVKTPYSWLALYGDQGEWFSAEAVMDWVAMLHLLNLEVRDAGRMADAHAHLLEVVRLSRLNWAAVRAETDDANEWLPGPGQTGVLGINIGDEQVEAWLGFLDEAEKLLKGELLIPFWRGGGAALLDEEGEWREDMNDVEVGMMHPTLGVNVKRVFMEPTRFDLFLWIQGSAAAPYLEEGPRTEGDFWNRLNREFGENFPGFAVWIN